MIEFRWSKVDKKDNTPILKDTEIDGLAETLLADYKPQLLKEPGQVDGLHFLEFYLGATVRFMDVYYDEDEEPIWGATSFNDAEHLKVFDRENMRIKAEKLNRRTIVIDNYVMQKGKEGLGLFTGLHEGGHLWLHPGVFTEPDNSGQLSLFKDEEPKIRQVVCCRHNNIESFGRKKVLKTAEDFREHQADYFASAITAYSGAIRPSIPGTSDHLVR